MHEIPTHEIDLGEPPDLVMAAVARAAEAWGAELERQGMGGRLHLPGGVAGCQELSVLVRVADVDPQRIVPAVGQRRQFRVKRGPQGATCSGRG